jgi:hypothetical protein
LNWVTIITLLELAKSGKTIKKSTCKRKNEEEHQKLTKSDTWALGGSIATNPFRVSASLSSQVNVLSHPVIKSFKMQTDG